MTRRPALMPHTKMGDTRHILSHEFPTRDPCLAIIDVSRTVFSPTTLAGKLRIHAAQVESVEHPTNTSYAIDQLVERGCLVHERELVVPGARIGCRDVELAVMYRVIQERTTSYSINLWGPVSKHARYMINPCTQTPTIRVVRGTKV